MNTIDNQMRPTIALMKPASQMFHGIPKRYEVPQTRFQYLPEHPYLLGMLGGFRERQAVDLS
jgi:hypothetical protein